MMAYLFLLIKTLANLTIKAKKFIFKHMKNLYNLAAIFFDTIFNSEILPCLELNKKL